MLFIADFIASPMVRASTRADREARIAQACAVLDTDASMAEAALDRSIFSNSFVAFVSCRYTSKLFGNMISRRRALVAAGALSNAHRAWYRPVDRTGSTTAPDGPTTPYCSVQEPRVRAARGMVFCAMLGGTFSRFSEHNVRHPSAKIGSVVDRPDHDAHIVTRRFVLDRLPSGVRHIATRCLLRHLVRQPPPPLHIELDRSIRISTGTLSAFTVSDREAVGLMRLSFLESLECFETWVCRTPDSGLFHEPIQIALPRPAVAGAPADRRLCTRLQHGCWQEATAIRPLQRWRDI